MKKLKTTIEIGGTLNESFAAASKKAGSSIERVGKSIRNIELKQSKINQFSTLKKEADKTADAYAQSNDKLSHLKKEMAKTDKPSKQLIKDFKSTEKETLKLQKALTLKQARVKTLGKSLGELSNSESKLRHENAKLSVSMANSQKRFAALSRISGADLKGKLGGIARQARNISLAFIGVGAAIGGASYKLVKGTSDNADAMGKLADRVDFSTESLQQWQYITEIAGVPVEKLNNGLDAFSKKLGKARYGKGTLYSDLRKADSDLYDELIAATNTQDAFEILVKRLRETQRKDTREAIVEATMGPLQLASLANLSAKEIEQLKKKKLELGIVSKKGVDLSAQFSDNLANVKHAVEGLKASLAERLLPTFNHLAIKLETFVQGQGRDVNKWAKSLGQTIEDFVPRFFAFTGGLMRGLHAIIKPMDKIINLFGGWETIAYAVSAVIGGKMVLSIISLGRAIVTTGLAMRALAVTSIPGIIASAASFGTTLLTLSSAALPAVIAGIRGISLALVSSPIGLAIAGIATGATLIYANWEKVTGVFARLKKGFQAFLNVVKKLSFGIFKRLFGDKEKSIDTPKKPAKKRQFAKAALLSAPLIAHAGAPIKTPQQKTNNIAKNYTQQNKADSTNTKAKNIINVPVYSPSTKEVFKPQKNPPQKPETNKSNQANQPSHIAKAPSTRPTKVVHKTPNGLSLLSVGDLT